jgi:hypothetical protein
MKDITVIVSKFLQITGIMNRTLKPSPVQKHMRLEIFNTGVISFIIWMQNLGN